VTAVPARRSAVGAIVGAAVALGGCASVSEDAQNNSLEALSRQTPTPKKYEPPARKKKVSCARPFDSLRAGELPPLGRMATGSYMETIRKRGKLWVGVDQNTLRLGYFNPKTKTMTGLDIDLVRAVARAIFGTSRGRIVFKAISTAQRESVIELGEVDLVASAFSITCKRLQNMYFSSVYYRAQQKLLVLEDSTVDSLSDLRGKQVCATKKSTTIDNLEGTGVVPHPVELRPDCLVELQEGKVAAITADDSILFGFRQQDRQTKIVGGCINVERYAMAINRRHPEFVRFVNGVLKRLGPAGVEQIRRRWLNGLTAPTRDEIALCDRRTARRRAATKAAKLRRAGPAARGRAATEAARLHREHEVLR
jgi:polar amino acid transport system substrate-binding protein